jgi:drug/metabolite transporter (DMT)-like permease
MHSQAGLIHKKQLLIHSPVLKCALMRKPLSANTTAFLQASLVTFLWATSWVLIKIGLGNIPALTFAGLRYVLATLFLFIGLLRPTARQELRSLSRSEWFVLALLGVVYYTVTQGAQFVALEYLPANTLSLLLSLSSIVIALLGLLFLSERMSALQWLGVMISLAGAFIYFGNFSGGGTLGLAWAAVCVIATSISAIQGRAANRLATRSPFTITLVSMGIGAFLLLAAGLLTEPFPALSARDWLIIAWLAAVNTAYAFVLWNHTLRTLTAAQSGVINNTILIHIVLLAWVFLGERFDLQQGLGLLVVVVGTIMVQWQRGAKTQPVPADEVVI